jgi:exodeoxyribonuclease V alpha subunit
MGVMKTEPQPSDRGVLAGLVERVTYQNAENGSCAMRVKARSHRDLVTVVGHAAVISAAEWITAAGDWTNDRIHGQPDVAAHHKRQVVVIHREDCLNLPDQAGS